MISRLFLGCVAKVFFEARALLGCLWLLGCSV